MRHATNRVKGFYAKTNKPARLNMFVGLAWRLPRLLSGTRAALCARVTAELKTAANPLPTFNKQLSAFPAHATFSYLPCPGGGMADAEDLKSSGDFSSCGFDSHPGHHFLLCVQAFTLCHVEVFAPLQFRRFFRCAQFCAHVRLRCCEYAIDSVCLRMDV